MMMMMIVVEAYQACCLSGNCYTDLAEILHRGAFTWQLNHESCQVIDSASLFRKQYIGKLFQDKYIHAKGGHFEHL